MTNKESQHVSIKRWAVFLRSVSERVRINSDVALDYTSMDESLCQAMIDSAPKLRTALAPFDPSAGWLPIESAPKDRIIILRNGKTVTAGFFDENETRYKWAFLDWAFLESTSKQFGPTHWQELPAAPEAT